jgi:phospholipid/cholesterol/gamma-HCH transport system substrate-binding protein
MENSKKTEYKVGLFVAFGLVAIMASILALGGNRVFKKYIIIHAQFTEVQGLFPGSIVSLAGVPVGNVKDITFVNKENKLDLSLQIDREFADRLVEGTVGEIRTQGALGDKFVYLAPGETAAPALKDDAIVKTIETDFMKMLTSREDGAARIIDLIKDVQVMVANLNAGGKLGTTVVNLAEASGKLNTTLGKINSLLDDVHGQLPENQKLRNSMQSLTSILEKVDKGKGTLGQLINDPSLHQTLKSFLGGSTRSLYVKEMLKETVQKGELKP